jgi:acyl carrier protein
MDPSTDLKPRVKQLIVRQLKLEMEPAAIDDDAPLFGEAGSGLGLDSIDALELVLGVEKEFGIKIQDEEVGVTAFASVNALCDFIRAKGGEGAKTA